MKQEFSFPKLPDQDDYLLDLQNNNYSMRTVYNYARDLCIFAMFIKTHKTNFNNVDKKSITIYKGYLKNGDHISDLNNFREDVVRNAGIITESGAKLSKGSKTNDEDSSGMLGTLSQDENDEIMASQSENDKNHRESYLDNVYRKVYGSLGSLRTAVQGGLKKSDGLDAQSINRMLSSLRSYLKYRIEFDLDVPIPPDAVKLIKAPKKIKQVASFDELLNLIECPMVFEDDEKVRIRNRCMLELLFSTGMRISELIGLNLEQITDDGRLFILGKGRKQRFVYLTPRAMEWLDKYLNIRLRYVNEHDDPDTFDGLMPGQKAVKITFSVEKGLDNSENPDSKGVLLDDNGNLLGKNGNRGTNKNIDASQEGDENDNGSNKTDSVGLEIDPEKIPYLTLLNEHRKTGFIMKFHSPALFIPFSGGRNGHRGLRLSTNYFQEKIADYRRRLGIQVPTSAHSLRHGFATYLAENGAPAAAIQVLLGHESLSTTTKYVHASDKFAEKTHREMHPLRR